MIDDVNGGQILKCYKIKTFFTVLPNDGCIKHLTVYNLCSKHIIICMFKSFS